MRASAGSHAHLDRKQADKTVSPSSEAWTEAAVLAGVLARTQGLAVPKKNLTPTRNAANGAAGGTAVEQGMLLLSGNIRHMDLLLQLRPCGNVLLYRPAEETAAGADTRA